MTIREDAQKFWLKSKTILWNLLLAVAGVWSVFESYVPYLNAVLGDKWFGITMFTVGMVGIALRFVTKAPLVKVKKAEPNDIISRS